MVRNETLPASDRLGLYVFCAEHAIAAERSASREPSGTRRRSGQFSARRLARVNSRPPVRHRTPGDRLRPRGEPEQGHPRLSRLRRARSIFALGSALTEDQLNTALEIGVSLAERRRPALRLRWHCAIWLRRRRRRFGRPGHAHRPAAAGNHLPRRCVGPGLRRHPQNRHSAGLRPSPDGGHLAAGRRALLRRRRSGRHDRLPARRRLRPPARFRRRLLRHGGRPRRPAP